MGFTDALKRSLGFEEDTSLHNKQQNNYRRPSTPSSDFRMSNNNASDLAIAIMMMCLFLRNSLSMK